MNNKKTTNIYEWDLVKKRKVWGWELVKNGIIEESYFNYSDKETAIEDFKPMAEHRGYTVFEPTTEQYEDARKVWQRVADSNKWGIKKVFVQLFISKKTNQVTDSVSFKALKKDIWVWDEWRD